MEFLGLVHFKTASCLLVDLWQGINLNARKGYLPTEKHSTINGVVVGPILTYSLRRMPVAKQSFAC